MEGYRERKELPDFVEGADGDEQHNAIKSVARVPHRFATINSLISVLENYFVRTTAVPRPNPSVRAAFPLFTPISIYPLEPT